MWFLIWLKTKMETEVVSAAMLYFAGWSFGNDTNYTDIMNHILHILLMKMKLQWIIDPSNAAQLLYVPPNVGTLKHNKIPSFTTVLYTVVPMCASSIFTRSSVRIATLPQTSTAKISWRQLQSHHHPPQLEQFWVVLESSLRLSLRPCNFYIFFHDLLMLGDISLTWLVRLATPFLPPNISFQGLLRRVPGTLNDRTVSSNSYYSVITI